MPATGINQGAFTICVSIAYLGREPVNRRDLQTAKRTPLEAPHALRSRWGREYWPHSLTPDANNCVYGYHRMLAGLYLVEGLK